MPRLPTNLPAYFGLSLLIFLLLMAVYWLFVEKPRHKVDISTSYTTLAAELGDQNLLPPVGDDTMLSNLAGMTLDPRRLRVPEGGSVGLAELGLGEVLTARVMDAEVFRIELKPQAWRELPRGKLRDALRRISRTPLNEQQASPGVYRTDPTSPVFAFRESYGGSLYEIAPIFEQDGSCVLLMISRVEK